MPAWLVVGATSGIAIPLVRLMAARGMTLCLAGRDERRLRRLADDLRARSGAEVALLPWEAHEQGRDPEAFLDAVEREVGPLDGLLWAVGLLGDRERAERDPAHAREIIEVNFLAALTLLNAAAARFEARRGGHIVAIGSVAGDRGRAGNYVYGASKAALHAALQGLRQRLAGAGVRVTTVKPGFVATKMTEGLRPPPWGSADPGNVARDILRGIERGAEVVYTPWFMRWVMLLVRHVPERLFKRFSF